MASVDLSLESVAMDKLKHSCFAWIVQIHSVVTQKTGVRHIISRTRHSTEMTRGSVHLDLMLSLLSQLMCCFTIACEPARREIWCSGIRIVQTDTYELVTLPT